MNIPLEKQTSVDPAKPAPQTEIHIDYSKLAAFLEKEVFPKVERPTSNIKISQDKDGKVIFEGYAENGLQVDKPKFTEELAIALNQSKTTVTIPVSETSAKVETTEELQKQGIKSLIGVGHTAYAGSPNARQHNIRTAIKKFNGLIIKPGETFSFNDNLGEVDGSTGYMKELVIKAEGTIPEYGGGVCQVSSTAYKAALFSGLEIDERSNHSYAVSYYAQIDGYGLDSTIYPGVKDLKFTNNTPGSILMQAYVKDTEAFFKFYGTDDGRKVKLEGPYQSNYKSGGGTELIPSDTLPPGQRKQIEFSHPGFNIMWYRHLTDKDGMEKKEEIFSSYRATANRILVGKELEPEAIPEEGVPTIEN
jgi:vancomycin resistance protein YoaR